MQNSTKVMLVAVLLLIVIIAVVWDRQNEKIKEGQIHVPVRLPDELVAAEPESVPQMEPAIVVGEIGAGEALPAPPPRMADGSFTPFSEERQRETVRSAEPPPPTAPEPEPEPLREYKVEPGDSFWTIAKKFYGDGNRWRKIFEANKDKIPTPESLRPKMTITVPGMEPVAAPSDTEEETPPAAGGQRIHVVAKGETLSDIARRYYGNANYRPILAANSDRIPDKNHLSVGIKLVIP